MIELIQSLPMAPLVAIAGGLFGTVYGIYRRDQLATALTWPVTEGTISEARVEEFEDTRHHNDRGPTTMYRPVVAVDYRVQEKEYRTRQFGHAGVALSWQSGAESLLRRYPKGTKVTVHVNPDRHADAIVDPQIALRWATVVLAL